MKNALKVMLLVILAMVASVTGLGFNFFGVTVCETNSTKIATLYGITVNSDSNLLVVSVKPTSSAKADFAYVVDLYERGELRASATVLWNQVQANVQETQSVSFPISSQEADAYGMVTERQLRKTFSIKVHE